MSAIRRDNMDAPGTGREQVAVFVDLHAIRDARFGFRPSSRIEKSSAVRDGAIRFDVIDHPDRVVHVSVADVYFFFVRRKGDAVGRFEVLGQ
jgi:hypothetical protein